ncbi:hypothetical protein DSCO28_34330 [Desulfosarcina ovata subsp. sediminis]|uniref:Hydantoinase/oxoprolinase N-terminal domain-containing protein n=1 Tax=Desulfosarcina ovata subsp. sediminis TaxID=885957 RepID=A0A5K7ZPY1_9BACT|nr:hydantoinase/oxoprolinase N-terminal domain-containing protein [Desulfosarcina ovata]BBO82867.1 hypothetical protein DSCO28_34330 [Desulfosarcina ovata subsp. sediminis]
MKYIIGVDVGGTFMDLVCMDEFGNSVITKTPSTPNDPSIAIMLLGPRYLRVPIEGDSPEYF